MNQFHSLLTQFFTDVELFGQEYVLITSIIIWQLRAKLIKLGSKIFGKILRIRFPAIIQKLIIRSHQPVEVETPSETKMMEEMINSEEAYNFKVTELKNNFFKIPVVIVAVARGLRRGI